MKKSVKILIVSIFVLLIGLVAFFYFHTKKAINIILPEFDKIEKVNISFQEDTLLLNADIKFENKSFLKLNVDSIIYNIKLDTLTLLSKAQFLGSKFFPGETDTVKLPIRLPFKRLSNEIKDLQGRDSVGITFDLRLVYSTLFGETTLPYKKTITVAVPVPPKFEIIDLDYVGRDKNMFNFNAQVKVINKGKLDLYISDIKYDLVVKDKLKANGKEEQEIHLVPRSEKTVTLPIKVEFEHLFKTLLNIATNNDKVDYHLKIDAMVRIDKLSKEKTKIHLEKKGNTELKK